VAVKVEFQSETEGLKASDRGHTVGLEIFKKGKYFETTSRSGIRGKKKKRSTVTR